MSIFKMIKANVTARQAAERYGLTVSRKGMVCCPFHKDRTPSMKIDERYYCFGCGATGDVIDLTSRLLGLETRDAAIQIAADFGISIDEPSNRSYVKKHPVPGTKKNPQKEVEEWMEHACKVLVDYRWLLRDFEESDAPTDMEDSMDNHPLFCLALQQKTYIDYLLDELMHCDKDQFIEMKNSYEKEVARFEERLSRIESGGEKGTGRQTNG